MRLIAAVATLLLAASTAEAAMIRTNVFVVGSGGGADYVADSRSGDSLDLGAIDTATRLDEPGGSVAGRAAIDMGAGRFGLSGALSRPGFGAAGSSYVDAGLNFLYKVDRDATITFGGSYSGARLHDGPDADTGSAYLSLEGATIGRDDHRVESVSILGAGGFSGDLFYTQAVTAGRIYSFQLYLSSSISGAFATGSHVLDYLFGIDTGGATLTVTDYKPTPVPLPAPALLLGVAIGALGLARRRRLL